jgi:hypothetical protein
MTRILPFLFLLLSIYAPAQKRDFDLSDLVHSAFVPDEKLSSYVTRIGFKTNKLTAIDPEQPQFVNKQNKEKITRLLSRQETTEGAVVAFETSSKYEYNLLKQDLLENQFSRVVSKVRDEEEFQKENIIIKVYNPENDSANYRIVIDRKAMPRVSELVYAEDLLSFSSHEYLVSVFGRANIKKDTFYYSEKEYTTCSVLYPNTFSQAIFLWEDVSNFRSLSLVIVGERWDQDQTFLNTQGAAQNKWKSRNGTYIGMSLNELVKLNNNHIELFGWNTEQPGYAALNNVGALDFRRVGIQLLCLDCKDDKYYTKTNRIKSEALLRSQSRVYINKMVLIPEKNINKE